MPSKIRALAFTALLGIALPIAAQDHSGHSAPDLVDVASEAGAFTTLLAAAEAAGLVDTLRSEGPFTVFAPTDEAFANLPDGTVESLLADPEALRTVLLYHVVSGRVTAEQVVGLSQAESVEGSALRISVHGDVVHVDDARVITADVSASNGVIHVIDAVLIPASLAR
jgi:uncharacterized surface protein with fasciclin (FAS1) repeats